MATVVGEIEYRVSIDTSSLKGQLSKVKSEVEGTSTNGVNAANKLSRGWSVALNAVTFATQKVFNGVYNSISSNISAAVKRVDTLNQFPKVMKNFGVSADEAKKSINRIKDSVLGLPTTLDQAAGGVQNLFLVTKDLKKSEALFQAVNDSAMVFAQGSTQAIDHFIYAYRQALSSGKVSAANFNQMNEAIPGIMDKVAETMGMTFVEMKNGLSDGSISIDDFNKALVKLDKEGSASMDSLRKAAFDATGGIQTSVDIMNAEITRGIEAVIKSIGEQNIQATATALGDAIEKAGKALANIISFVKENKDWIAPLLAAVTALAGLTVAVSKASKAISFFKDTWGGLGKSIGGALGKIKKPKMDATTLLGGDPKKTLADTLRGLGDTIRAFGEPLKAVLDVFKQVLVGAAEAIAETIKVIFKGIGEAIAGFFSALANPTILLGAAVFAGVAAAIAAAILLIGGAIGITMPAWEQLFNKVIMPSAIFIRDTVLMILDNLTKNIIKLTNQAIIPLGNFMLFSFVVSINAVTNALIRLTRQAVIPLVNTLSGAFTRVVNSISNLISGTLRTALQGVKGIIDSVGGAFTNMGNAIRNALNGVSGVLREFRGLVDDIGNAMIGLMALATGQSVTYGRGFAKVTKAAMGGRVFGIGTSTSDSNLYALSKGEYVVRASSAKSIGYDMLDYMNTTGRIGGGTNEAITVNQYNTVNTPVDMQIINQRLGNAVRRATA